MLRAPPYTGNCLFHHDLQMLTSSLFFSLDDKKQDAFGNPVSVISTLDVDSLVEARGVEPLSETISTRASTGVSCNFTFPTAVPYKQGHTFSIL